MCSSSNEAHVASGSSGSAQGVAAEASAVAASIGCFVFAAGSSNGSSSWSATPSRVRPLSWLGELGFATGVSYLKESSRWESVCVWWSSLERQPGTRFALPDLCLKPFPGPKSSMLSSFLR